jgi:hypothetical protein
MPDSLLLFDVYGPYKIPIVRERNGSYIPARCPDFWDAHPTIATRFGCYVFAIRAGKGITPVYVGKTTRSFDGECFAIHKIACHYTPALARKGRGTPVMFFLVPRARRGKPNTRIIKDLETFLIQVASAKNPSLSNVKERQEARWGISGVLRGGKGKPGKPARAFKTSVGM